MIVMREREREREREGGSKEILWEGDSKEEWAKRRGRGGVGEEEREEREKKRRWWREKWKFERGDRKFLLKTNKFCL